MAQFRSHHGGQKHGGSLSVIRIFALLALAGFLFWVGVVVWSGRAFRAPEPLGTSMSVVADSMSPPAVPVRRDMAGYFLPQGHGGQVVMHRQYAVGYDSALTDRPLWVAWELTREEVMRDSDDGGEEMAAEMVAEMYFVEQATMGPWEELVESMRQLALERRHVYVVVGRLEDGFYVVVQDYVEPEVEEFAWMVRNGGGGDL
ncbi:MAG: hypothetical protein ACO4CH_10100, partial [Saprospiraceae bacterium]